MKRLKKLSIFARRFAIIKASEVLYTTTGRHSWSSLKITSVVGYFQLFSYPSISPVSAMSGVISPTNLSLFSSPVTVSSAPRTSSRHAPPSLPRWTPPGPPAPSAPPPGPPNFITLEEDYMMTPLISGANPDSNTTLMDDGNISSFCLYK